MAAAVDHKLAVEYRPVDSLAAYARNARTHSEAQLADLARAIKQFGFTNPVLVDETGTLIAGHGRVEAAKRAGLAEVPCIELRGLSDSQRRGLILADNKLALNSGWDESLLALELDDLRDMQWDMTGLGFAPGELMELIGVGRGDVDPLTAMPALPDGEKTPFQQMTFTLHDDQAGQVAEAIAAAKRAGAFAGSLNENSNGNALARICATYLVQHVER